MNSQVKDKKRVQDHGEVFTSDREVNAMLDLVKNETVRIDSRFLEPACGNGNFLAEILNRKLAVIVQNHKNSLLEFERYSVIGVGSMYGVDILTDNVDECRERLFEIFKDKYIRIFGDKHKPEFLTVIEYILSKNILWGNALTLKSVDGAETPIRFAQWSAINGTKIKRRDYSLANLLDYQPMGADTLFSDMGEQAIIPPVLKDFPATDYMDLPKFG